MNIWHETLGSIFANNPSKGLTEQQVDSITELAIDLLASSGYDPSDPDETGGEVSDDVQTHLMCAMMLAPKLAKKVVELLNDDDKKTPEPVLNTPPHLKIDAFNLFEGAAIHCPAPGSGGVWVVMSFSDDSNVEKVSIIARRADLDTDTPWIRHFVFDYCEKVMLVGNVRNKMDLDDNNWGQN